jgi:hypothetical protein
MTKIDPGCFTLYCRYFYIFLKSSIWNKKNKIFLAEKFKMAAKSKMAALTFFVVENFKNNSSSKKSLMLFFLTKNTTFVEQFFSYKFKIEILIDFFLKIQNGGIIYHD